jgi:hypothetical protein
LNKKLKAHRAIVNIVDLQDLGSGYGITTPPPTVASK